MNSAYRSKLEEIGLSRAEAQVYLALLHHGPLVAAAVAKETGIPRTGVYPTLGSLADKGLIEGGLAQGSKFAAVAPEEALPALIIREEQALSEHKQIANELAETLAPLAADAQTPLDDTVEVVRTPQIITERWQRIQNEIKRSIEAFVKAPILSRSNPAQKKTRKRGVQYRIIYEHAVIEDPRIGPFLKEWIAGGEEARVYDGELPYKLTLFDRELVMFFLARRSGAASAMFIKHALFARSTGILFDYFWEHSKPLVLEKTKVGATSSTPSASPAANIDPTAQRVSLNGRRRQPAEK
jgi:HTH-type transcriptional regulator, sugar sensing transcriptional regulator